MFVSKTFCKFSDILTSGFRDNKNQWIPKVSRQNDVGFILQLHSLRNGLLGEVSVQLAVIWASEVFLKSLSMSRTCVPV